MLGRQLHGRVVPKRVRDSNAFEGRRHSDRGLSESGEYIRARRHPLLKNEEVQAWATAIAARGEDDRAEGFFGWHDTLTARHLSYKGGGAQTRGVEHTVVA